MKMSMHEPEVTATVQDADLVRRRRAQIIEAATALFSREGFHRVTVKDIAQRAGFSPGLVYQYVSDKDDILFLVLRDIVDVKKSDMQAAIEGEKDPLPKLLAALDAYIMAVDQHRDAVLLAYRETKALNGSHRAAIKRLELETNQLIAERIDQCVAAGLIRSCHVEVVSYMLLVTAHAWALKYWRLKDITTLEAYRRQTLETILTALFTNAGYAAYKRYQGRSKSSAPASVASA